MTDTRKGFEEWFWSAGISGRGDLCIAESAWQACQQLNDKRIADLLAVIEKQRDALLSLEIIEHDGGIGVGLVDCVMRSDVESALALQPNDVELVDAFDVPDKEWNRYKSTGEGFKFYIIKTKA